MANYLTTDTDLTAVADAIRTKGGTSEQLEFPLGFVEAIRGISGGEEPFFNRYGVMYFKKMEVPVLNNGGYPNYGFCENMEEINMYLTPNASVDYSAQPQNLLDRNTGLKKANIAVYFKIGHYFFRDCTSLQEVTLGKVGHDITGIGGLAFNGCNQSGLTITIYVADETAIPLSGSPFGATSATIIYRSSATGEVRTV